jgi:hypothetical protein
MLLGFRLCPNNPALYTNSRIIIMIFVDDFLAAYYLSEADYAY